MKDVNETQDVFDELYVRLTTEKPNDRSPRDRRYAILITELEELNAYYGAIDIDWPRRMPYERHG